MLIDIYRHLLSIAVIVQHMTSLSRYDAVTNTQISDIVYWVDGAVMGFFAISGFFSRPQQNLAVFIKTQAIKLLTPYLAFSFIYAVAMSLLGKESLLNGLLKTVTLYGGSMQLYFLPYLFAVISFFSIYNRCFTKHFSSMQRLLIWIAIFAIPLVLFPSNRSTGAGWVMLPLYAISFGLGSLASKIRSELNVLVALSLIAVGFIDHRATDLGIAFSGLVLFSTLSKYFLERRLPGSGGIYLLHTPIINFGISTFLVGIGIVQISNLFLSIALTYALCFCITWAVIYLYPRWRWLLLE